MTNLGDSTASMSAESVFGATGEGGRRARLLESGVALVEDLRGPAVRVERTRGGFSADFQVCLPYRGLFVWHVGGDDVIGDANQVLFVTGGEGFSLSQPLERGYAELIITPDVDVLAELARCNGGSFSTHALFRQRSRRADPALQQQRTRFLHRVASNGCDALAAEEWVIPLLRAALCADVIREEPGRSTRRLIASAKEFLEANLSGSIRLVDVARAVGASPAYLTDVFRRVEGVPLHKYLTQLRLARALVELPHAADLTTLALTLGFSSHSHFTTAFRRAFGCTPSRFRESTSSPRARA
jgi:AraC-like DNA-binding protein